CAASCLFLYAPATTQTYTLSLHDALPISRRRHRLRPHSHPAPDRALLPRRSLAHHPNRWHRAWPGHRQACTDQSRGGTGDPEPRSEEHTSELQSRENLVCRLLLEKKKLDK